MIVLIDTREQRPLFFTVAPTEPATLDTGDYSVKGLEHLIAVERKELSDLLGCISSGRERFKRELQRLRAYRFRLLVIETTAAEIERGEWRSKLTPNHILGNLAAWTAQYNLPVWLAGDHAGAGRFVERFLHQSCRRVQAEVKSATFEKNEAVV